jgi:hypothetical protein
VTLVRSCDALEAAALENPRAARACKRVASDVIGTAASVTDGDHDQAAAQDGQTSDNESEEASGNAIKVTHDTPLGSKGDGADQLIKTFGILKRRWPERIFLHGRALRMSRGAWPFCALGANCRTGSS